MPLDRCASCRRHVRADETACPFCRAARSAGLLATGLTALALTGCPEPPPPAPVYGAPTPMPAPTTDTAPVTTDMPPDAPVYGAPPPRDGR